MSVQSYATTIVGLAADADELIGELKQKLEAIKAAEASLFRETPGTSDAIAGRRRLDDYAIRRLKGETSLTVAQLATAAWSEFL